MTEEEALKGLIKERDLEKANRDIWDEEEDRIKSDRYVEMLNIAIKALKQKLCEDAISREKLIKDLNFLYNEEGFIKDTRAKRTIEVIMGQAPVNPQPKTGHCED